MFLTCACDHFFFSKSLRRAPAWRSGALAHSFPFGLQFLSVVSSILCLWTDNFTINFGSRKTQHICSVIPEGGGADLWESPLVCLVKEIGSEERRHMDAGQIQALLQQQAQFPQQTVEQQTSAHTEAMNAMAEMIRALQIDVRASISGEGRRKHDDQACCHDAAPLFLKS